MVCNITEGRLSTLPSSISNKHTKRILDMACALDGRYVSGGIDNLFCLGHVERGTTACLDMKSSVQSTEWDFSHFPTCATKDRKLMMFDVRAPFTAVPFSAQFQTEAVRTRHPICYDVFHIQALTAHRRYLEHYIFVGLSNGIMLNIDIRKHKDV